MAITKKQIEIHNDRIKMAIRFLKRIHHQKFSNPTKSKPKGLIWDMSLWGEHHGAHDPEENNYCGTSACALGHMALNKNFNAEGLKGTWQKSMFWEDECYRHYLQISYRSHYGIGAAKKFFGLTTCEAESLFTGKSRKTPNDVAQEFESLLTSREELRG